MSGILYFMDRLFLITGCLLVSNYLSSIINGFFWLAANKNTFSIVVHFVSFLFLYDLENLLYKNCPPQWIISNILSDFYVTGFLVWSFIWIPRSHLPIMK